MMRRFSLKAAVLAGVLLMGALIPALAQQRDPGLVGDVNGDGRITSADALAVYAYLAGRPIPASFDVPGRGDADGDGQITRADAELIMRVAVGQASGDRPVGKPVTPGTAPAEGPLRLQCVANTRSATVRCSEPGAPAPAGVQGDRIYYGGQHVNVSLLTDNVTTVADTFAFDMRVKNLIGQAIGTHDGVTMDSVKVFFDAEPRNTSSTPNNGVVTAVNHDGAQPFITSEPQKYFAYGEIIQPGGTSAVRRWKLRRDAAVESFTFFLWVSSPVQHPNGWVDVYPDSAEISAGATLQLTDTVRNRLGRPVGGTVTYSSANPAVATVSTDGLVTGVADGTVVITGSTPNRSSGTMTLRVLTASADSSTFTAVPASLPVHDTSTVTLQLRSANGTPLNRSAGTVMLSASSGSLAATDNNDGTYTATLTSSTVGLVKVSGTLNGVAFSDTAEVTFTAGAAAGYVVTSSADSVAAGSQVTITAQTVDADSNAVAASGTVINWSSTNGGSFATPTSTTNASGAATVVFTTSTTAGVTHTVTATDSLGLTGTSGNIVTRVGAAARLAVVQQPTNTVAGSPITPAVTVAIQDANGNTVTSAADSVTVSIGTNPSTGTLSGTTTVAAVNGVATFSNLSIDKVGTGYALKFTSGSLADTTSSAFNVTAGAAAKLVLVTQPSDSTQSGAAFPRQPVLQLEDANGNPVAQAGVSVTAAIATGGGTLGGTVSVNTDANGTATFTDLSISGTVGDRTLSFSSTGLTGVNSNTVSVTAGAAAQLVFTTQPSNTTAASTITPAVQVTATDASGNVVTGFTGNVTVAIGTNPSSGTLSGTATVAAVSGVATFSDLSIDKSGTGYTLGASSGSLTGTSAAFNVTAGAASHATSTITANPTSIVADGASTSTITVQLKDASGNNLTASGGTVLIETSHGTMSATTDNNDGTYTATLTSGTVVANTVQITAKLDGTNLANTTTVAFTPGAPASYVVSRSEINPVAGATVTIYAQLVDANGNAVPVANRTVTWSSTGGGSFATPTSQTMSTGEATVVFTTSTTAGTVHTVTATDGDGITGTSGPITTQVGAAAKLGFIQQPSNTVAGATITPAVTVAIQDANGNTVTTASEGVTIAIGNNPGSGTLGGTVTVGPVNGIVTFPDLSINKAGAGYTLSASATGLTGATSSAFDITPGTPAALAFTVQPSNVVASAPITPAVQVSIVDANGNLVTTATDNVTLAIGTNPSGGTLSGTTTVAAVNGVATFSNLSINLVGAGYTLAGTSGSLTGTTSTLFDVTHGPLHHFLVEAAGGGPIGAQLAGTPFNVRVTAQDEFNNTVTNFTGTVGFTSTPSGGITAGGTSGAFTAGVLTSHAITFGTPGSFTLTATNTAGAQAGTSNSFEVQAPPTAVNEGPAAGSAPGQPFHAFYSTAGNPQTYTLAAPGLLANDNLGFPAATITSFGADSLGGSVTTYAAGTTVNPLPGTGRTTGSLSVGADGSVTFTPPDGFTGNYVFRYRLTNVRGTADGTVTIAVGARPAAANDTYPTTLLGNVPINTATSSQFRVTTNDTGDGKVLAITGQSNGTATLNADSTFTFRPNPGFEGSASFTYTVTNGFGTSAPATVSMTVANPVWFLNSGAAGGGDGRYDTPFNALSSFAAINNGTGSNPAANDRVFLYTGAYSGPVTLLNGQQFIGQGATGSTFSSLLGVTWPADSGAEPAINGTSPSITSATTGVTLGSGNTLRGFNLGNTTGAALIGSSFGTVVVTNVGINTTGQALSLTTGTLNGGFTQLRSTGGTNNVFLSGVATTGTSTLGAAGDVLSGATGDAFVLAGGTGSYIYSGNVTQASNAATVNVSGGHSGTLTFQTGTVSATNGTGLQFNNADGTYAFSGTTTLNGGNAGIDVSNGSSGTFTFPSTASITNPTAETVAISNSAPTFTYAGTLSKTNNSGSGITLSSNTGGTITFSGTSKVFSTGASAAVNITGNGATILFTGGGLDIDVSGSNATGFTASGGGSVTVQGSTNTIDLTTGSNAAVALSVSGTTIAAGGLNFTRISSSGGANGIVLNNTGATAGLTVSGTGSAGTGGTIQNTSGDGVRLASTVNTSLNWMNFSGIASAVSNAATCNANLASGCESAIDMNAATGVTLNRISINGAGQAGITAFSSSGLTVTNSSVVNVGDADGESGMILHNLSGTSLIQDVTVDNPEEFGIKLFNSTGTGGLTLRRVTVQNNVGTFGEAGFQAEVSGGTTTVLVDDSDFLNTDGTGVFGTASATGVLNMTVQASTMTGNLALPSGINFTTGNTAIGRLTATGNVINGCASGCSMGIDLDASLNSTLEATVLNNTIVDAGIGTGIEFISNENSVARGRFEGNTITVQNSRVGMNFHARPVTANPGTSSLDLTLKSNTINGVVSGSPGAVGYGGVQFQAGSSLATDHNQNTICVNLATGQSSGSNVVNGTNDPGLVSAYTVRQRANTTFKFQGFAGTGTSDASVESFITANNPGGTMGGTVDVFSAAGSGNGATIVNYTSGTCATPAATPLP